jgi:hypothetical protein
LKFWRKLDVPKGNWDWGVGGEIWPLPSDEYWDGEPWFRRFVKFLGLGSIELLVLISGVEYGATSSVL